MDSDICPNDDDSQADRDRNLYLAIIIIIIAFVVIMVIGLVGFTYFFNLSFLDAFHNSAMYITGMGPISLAQTSSQKVFASIYSILGGFLFLGIAIYLVDEIVDILFFANRSQ